LQLAFLYSMASISCQDFPHARQEFEQTHCTLQVPLPLDAPAGPLWGSGPSKLTGLSRSKDWRRAILHRDCFWFLVKNEGCEFEVSFPRGHHRSSFALEKSHVRCEAFLVRVGGEEAVRAAGAVSSGRNGIPTAARPSSVPRTHRTTKYGLLQMFERRKLGQSRHHFSAIPTLLRDEPPLRERSVWKARPGSPPLGSETFASSRNGSGPSHFRR
jgi:hypothetical protein